MDMVFAARQLVEKAREHDNSLFLLFMTLKRPMTLCLRQHCGMCFIKV